MSVTLTICGLNELDCLSTPDLTHALSIVDPGLPEPEQLRALDPACRTTLRFHDEIEPGPGLELPRSEHVRAILAFGNSLIDNGRKRETVHALVHCQMGISRSTAAAATLLTQLHSGDDEDHIFKRVLESRPQAWPNCLMIAMADDLLGRGGRLTAALGRLYARQLAVRPGLGIYMRENGRGFEVDMALAGP